MSADLWKYFFEDDVEGFRQYLEDATFTSIAPKTGGGLSAASSKIAGSPGTLSTSPRTPFKSRKSYGKVAQFGDQTKRAGHVLTRADLNARDNLGRTLLHHLASSKNTRAIDFVHALLGITLLDLYIQDAESGWTPLHRALYYGNAAIAQALMLRDIKDATDYTTAVAHAHAGGLVKIKDHEGNSPFEVFALTIAPRSIQMTDLQPSIEAHGEDVTYDMDVYDEDNVRDFHLQPVVDLEGDEAFAFGSNKNYSLGLGDQDDRQYPERVFLKRPVHVLRRLCADLKSKRRAQLPVQDAELAPHFGTERGIPAVTQHQRTIIQDVVVSKLHTAVLTTDPISNLHMCGYGPTGRMGTGDLSTRFSFTCIDGGGLASRRITAIALGQDHSLAISSKGEVFTWGANQHDQLGYELPPVVPPELPVQLLPRQLYGNIRRESFIGAAASAIHSVIYTTAALFTFGRNAGQLGLMDADARSLESQSTPRRIGVSVLKSTIRMVSAIDRATSVLLDNNDLIVFTNYGYTKVVFHLQSFNKGLSSSNFMSSMSDQNNNFICKITSGGNAICAMSTLGEVFTIDVPEQTDKQSVNVSTTHPTRAKNALHPNRVWSIKKDHTAAIDVTTGQDGSVVLCTAAGSVWRKEKRAKIKSINSRGSAKPKDYKFVRVPNLTRVVAVRSNAFGSFFAIRQDSHITREQIVIDPPSLWGHVFSLCPFASFRPNALSASNDEPRFWKAPKATGNPAQIKQDLLEQTDMEVSVASFLKDSRASWGSQYDMWVTTSKSDVQIPMHAFMLKARSPVLRQALAAFETEYYFSIPGVLSIQYGADGQVRACFEDVDFLAITNLVFYVYMETLLDVWHYTSRHPASAPRYRQIRSDLMRIASALQMIQLERAARVMVDPPKVLQLDLQFALGDPDFFQDADLMIDLAEGVEMPAHSIYLCARCPFFDGLFHGRAGGQWMTHRRDEAQQILAHVRVDLTHMDGNTFEIVLNHIYTDAGEELFDKVVTESAEDFVELLIDVMSAANELMLDRLAQVCQKLLGNYGKSYISLAYPEITTDQTIVTIRNVCQLLNTVADCSVNEFKHVALEYICLNLEAMLEYRYVIVLTRFALNYRLTEGRLLEELDEDLIAELDDIIQQNQRAYQPFARNSRVHDEMVERHPGILEEIEEARRRRIDSMRLRSRLNAEEEERLVSVSKARYGSWDGKAASPSALQSFPSPLSTPGPSPAILPNDVGQDLLFDMEVEQEDADLSQNAKDDVDAKDSPLGYESLPPAALTDQNEESGLPQNATSRSRWAQSTPIQTKVDFKGILSEASASIRVSSSTSALGDVVAGSPSSARAQAKLSQKDRKRLHKEQAQLQPQTVVVQPDADPPASPTPSKSPWQQNLEPRRASHGVSVMNSSSGSVPITALSSSIALRPQSSRPDLARAPTSTSTTPRNSRQPQPTRSTSLPTAPSIKSPAPPPQIQSIRHTPLPHSSRSLVNARTSMADILSQQQTEKTAVKEAVAPRSLQEIQEEQEFQEWWDSESRRVQEEDASSKPNANDAKKEKADRGGRGGPRRRSRGRGGGAIVPAEPSPSNRKASQVAVANARGGRTEGGPMIRRGGTRGSS